MLHLIATAPQQGTCWGRRCMERRGSSGLASTSGSAPAASSPLEELIHVGARPDPAPPQRPQQRPLAPLLARRRGLKLACSGLALLTVYWIWAWYPQGDGFAGRTASRRRASTGCSERSGCGAQPAPSLCILHHTVSMHGNMRAHAAKPHAQSKCPKQSHQSQ